MTINTKTLITLITLLILSMIFSVGCAKSNNTSSMDDNVMHIDASSLETDTYADIEIENYGTITVALDKTSAPVTEDNFINLAENGFYDGLTFHRIMEGFMMQGGDPKGDGSGGADSKIVGEFKQNGYDNNISHTRGAISMARAMAFDCASSHFFIVHEDCRFLDGTYAGFGYVTEGMDIVDQICEEAVPTDNNGTIPKEAQPVIKTITIRVEE